MSWQIVLDRIEGNFAIFLVDIDEKEQVVKFPLALLPSNAKEGDIMSLTIDIDHNKTFEKKQEVENILSNLLNKSDI